MIDILLQILILGFIVFIVAECLPGIQLAGFGTAIKVAIVYSVINFLLSWILFIVAFPLIVITLGLFLLVINAVLLWITDMIVEDFKIDNFVTTLKASVLISLGSWVLGFIF